MLDICKRLYITKIFTNVVGIISKLFNVTFFRQILLAQSLILDYKNLKNHLSEKWEGKGTGILEKFFEVKGIFDLMCNFLPILYFGPLKRKNYKIFIEKAWEVSLKVSHLPWEIWISRDIPQWIEKSSRIFPKFRHRLLYILRVTSFSTHLTVLWPAFSFDLP